MKEFRSHAAVLHCLSENFELLLREEQSAVDESQEPERVGGDKVEGQGGAPLFRRAEDGKRYLRVTEIPPQDLYYLLDSDHLNVGSEEKVL